MTAMNVKRTKEEPIESIEERSITRAQNGNGNVQQQDAVLPKVEDTHGVTGDAPESDVVMVDSLPQPSAPAGTDEHAVSKSNGYTNGNQVDAQQTEQTGQEDDLFGAEPSPLPIDLSMDDVMNIEQNQKPQENGAASSSNAINNPTVPTAGGNDDDLDALFNQNDTTGPDNLNLDTNVNQQDAGMDSLLPGLEFYANENNATPGGGLDGFGDLTAGMDGEVPLPDLNGGNDTSGFDFGGDLDGQMQGTNFDDWLASVANENAQGADGQNNVGDAQFDANFFNLD